MRKQEIGSMITDLYTEYASEAILNTLPSIDGLIPVQRKVIWACHKNNVLSNKNFMKLLRISAYAMVYYVFGDMPLASAMKNMGNNSLNYFYLEPKGSFGNKNKVEGCGASPRYIEGKMSVYSEDMLKGINKGVVKMVNNFDDTETEPLVLPSMIPNILCNTSQSIASGYASKIPAFNLIEVCDGISDYIINENKDSLYDIIKAPDVSLGGRIIYDKDKIKKIYDNGTGSFTMLGKYSFNKETNVFSIYEIPYETYIETIEDKIQKSIDSGKFKEIVYMNDSSGKDGIRLDIELKKGTNVKVFESKLRKFTPYQCTFPANFTLLDLDLKTPVRMSLEQIVQKWIKFRISCIRKEYEFDIVEDKKTLNLLKGAEKVLLNIDEAVRIVKESKTDEEIVTKLMDFFKLNKIQATNILEIKLKNLNETYLNKKISRINEVEETLNSNIDIVENESKIKDIIIKQLQSIKKKYGKDRMTTIIEDEIDSKIDEGVVVENYNTKLYYTREGYFKKVKAIENRGNNKLKETDKIIDIISSTNKSELLFFTNKNNAYKKWGYEIDDISLNSYGVFLNNYFDLEDGEKIVKIISIDDYENGYVYALFYNEDKKRTNIAKLSPKAYQTKSNRTKISNATANVDNLVDIIYSKNEISFMQFSTDNRISINATDKISPKQSKGSRGVVAMKDVDLFNAFIVDNDSSIEFITTKGKEVKFNMSDKFDDKRTYFEYFTKSLNSKGNYIHNKNDKVKSLNKIK